MNDDIKKMLENMRRLEQLEEETQKMIPSFEKIEQLKREIEEYSMKSSFGPCKSSEKNKDLFNRGDYPQEYDEMQTRQILKEQVDMRIRMREEDPQSVDYMALEHDINLIDRYLEDRRENRRIFNPHKHQFKDKRLHKRICEHISLACEFVDEDNEREALERNMLEAFVVVFNTFMTEAISSTYSSPKKHDKLIEFLSSLMTEYL